MARRKKVATDGDMDGAASSRSKSLVPALLVAAAVLAAGFMMKGGDPAPAQAAPLPEVTEPVVEGPVVETEPMTLNLADGHYLKVGIALQLAGPAPGAPADDHAAAADGEGHDLSTAKALDLTIATFSGHTTAELSDPEVRDRVKANLTDRIAKAYHDEVIGLYFTDFVMQ